MLWIISYLITAICYYLVFFKAREEHYEYKTDNSHNREWVYKGKQSILFGFGYWQE